MSAQLLTFALFLRGGQRGETRSLNMSVTVLETRNVVDRALPSDAGPHNCPGILIAGIFDRAVHIDDATHHEAAFLSLFGGRADDRRWKTGAGRCGFHPFVNALVFSCIRIGGARADGCREEKGEREQACCHFHV